MLEKSAAGLTIIAESTKLVGDVAISLSFPIKGDCCTLAKLSGCACHKDDGCHSGAEETALAYAIYHTVNQVLCGDAVAVSKTKVGEATCLLHGDNFAINWKVRGTVSAVRKSLGIALKCLNPDKYHAVWVRLMKHLGGNSDQNTFNYVADQLAGNIKSHILVSVVGNINIDKEKLDDMIDILKGKLSVSAVSGTKTKPSTSSACDHSTISEIKTHGWESVVTAEYLRSKVKGLSVIQGNNTLMIPQMEQKKWDTVSKKLKDDAKTYVSARYAKMNKELSVVLGYLSISASTMTAHDVKKLLSTSLTVSSITQAIEKAL